MSHAGGVSGGEAQARRASDEVKEGDQRARQHVDALRTPSIGVLPLLSSAEDESRRIDWGRRSFHLPKDDETVRRM